MTNPECHHTSYDLKNDQSSKENSLEECRRTAPEDAASHDMTKPAVTLERHNLLFERGG